jgi:hypothetical protein
MTAVRIRRPVDAIVSSTSKPHAIFAMACVSLAIACGSAASPDDPVDVEVEEGSATKDRAPAKRFALELEGGAGGFIKSVSGGDTKAEVIAEKSVSVGSAYEPIRFQVGVSSSPAMYAWMKDSFDAKHSRKNGAILATDDGRKAKAIRTFAGALITEIGFPALTGPTTEAPLLTVTLQPRVVDAHPAATKPVAIAAKQQKAFSTYNFAVTIDGHATKVRSVDGIKITHKPTMDTSARQLEPAKLEFPNITIYVAASDAKSWSAAADTFARDGKTTVGSLVFVGIDEAGVRHDLAALELEGIAVLGVTPTKNESEVAATLHASDFRFVCFTCE